MGAASFAHINIAPYVEVDIRGWPLWGDADAVISTFYFAPPREFHEKIVVRKEMTPIDCSTTGCHPSLVNPVLDVPDVLEFSPAFLGVVNVNRRECNVPFGDCEKGYWNP